MGFLLILGVPFLLGAVLAVLLGCSRRRFAALVVLGVVLGFLLVLYAYLAAPHGYSPSNGCSDCEEYLGRWWEPTLVVALTVFAFVAYVAGVVIGAIVRLFMRRRRGRGTRLARPG